MSNSPINYKMIFIDILDKKFPQKKKECNSLLQKDTLYSMDIIKLNEIIFGSKKDNELYNPQHHSYSKNDIIQILEYQKKNKLNNSQLANHFKLSRNTITKWKRIKFSHLNE